MDIEKEELQNKRETKNVKMYKKMTSLQSEISLNYNFDDNEN